ncbi:amino acid ABC transporter ATP-binding protein [Natronosalvus rutilus]|uniref:Phosphate ABC transporter ATP-binding protein n=1 Tax=Natronosalvus rutilus TaxID=2953753 RepID=A0A9E7NA60_9EURY|nr:phosphate ABC transporter ATP-binding protein [Natronosalvus rutilus]UTF53105.1 phosphate ABC transporter ATP-binding protein [Natronosalvus rutilus]
MRVTDGAGSTEETDETGETDGSNATNEASETNATNAPRATIEARDVTHGYGRERVLEDVTLSVAPGEVVALIGPSGVGKTTLLRLLALFERPDDGTVRHGGEDVWANGNGERLDHRRRVGMVFQEPNLFGASVRQNVAYGLRVRQGWPERVRHSFASILGSASTSPAVAQALEAVGLESYADRDVDSLSGGEAQRVAFARALAYDPDVLVLDEPTSELDPRNTAILEDAVRTARANGIGVALATHDMHQARRVADRVGLLLDDGIVEIDETDTIFEDPSDDRTRQFIRGDLVY